MTVPVIALPHPVVLGTPAGSSPLGQTGSPEGGAAQGKDWKDERRLKTP